MKTSERSAKTKVTRRPRTTAVVARRHGLAHWRAATLASVYVLMAIHVTHWMIKGKTVAPLELNEVMYTFELGIITVGFLFMSAACVATLIFGRFFCSWGCHILALQDLSSWILRKLGIRPHGVRSRLMLWIPFGAALYMFAWPQATRIWQGRSAPELHLRTDAEGWASLTTQNFWRNLPGPGVIALTFSVCGFLIVYVLGSRGFCTYGCPYGVVFRLVDRLAPGRIRFRGRECLQCGTCTAACTSHVRVHEELNRYGMVVNPACLKDLDCTSACPQQNIHFGFGRPSLFKTVLNDTPVRKTYDFTLREEFLMVVVFIAVLCVFRGLYDLIPFLLSIALGTIVAYLSVVLLRLMLRPALHVNHWRLKISGRLTNAGWAFVLSAAVFTMFFAHSTMIRYHSFQGRRYAELVGHGAQYEEPAARQAIRHLTMANRWGLVTTDQDRLALANVLYRMAGAGYQTGARQEVKERLQAALTAWPDLVMAHYDLGALMIESGELQDGIGHLKRAVRLRPDFADAHYNLGVALAMSGSLGDAMVEIDRALSLQPKDEKALGFRAYLETLGAKEAATTGESQSRPTKE